MTQLKLSLLSILLAAKSILRLRLKRRKYTCFPFLNMCPFYHELVILQSHRIEHDMTFVYCIPDIPKSNASTQEEVLYSKSVISFAYLGFSEKETH